MLVKCLIFAGVLCSLSASPAAWAGTWEITVTPTNVKSSSTSNAQAASIALSNSTSATLIVSAGQTTSNVTATGRVAYSGTWKFKWIPDNSTDWPSAYKIKSIKARTYQSIVKNGSGSALVFLTGGANVIFADSPATGSSVYSSPVFSSTTDNSVSNLSVVTKSVSTHSAQSVSPNGWVETKSSSVAVERAYSATYFTANFASPSLVELTFTVESVDLSADLSFNGSATDSIAASTVVASEVFQGEPN